MNDELRTAVKEWVEYQIEKQKELEEKYPPNPPNDVCQNAYIKGLLIENSFKPEVGEINNLFETEYEKIYVWTHDDNKYSAIVVEVTPAVKDIPFWKNIANIIWMALQYVKSFEGITSYDYDYKWIYYFDANEKLLDQTFEKLSIFEEVNLNCGSVIKATDIAELSPEIELMLRDDKAYTALMMLCNSFLQHYICLICELSRNPYHDHLSEEPKIWEHASIIPNMEAAIVQACRSVEGILGEPPNSKKQAAVLKHKTKWVELTGIDPDSIFEKAGVSYLEFYYMLFFGLRNPSAHSYGNIHYDLEKVKAVQAQCFAAIIVRGYFNKHVLNQEEAKEKLKFNSDLLSRVDSVMSTKLTVNTCTTDNLHE